MKVLKVKNYPFDSTCYIVTIDGKNCLIIDLGGDFSQIEGVLKSNNLTPAAVLLTHCHYDHVNGVSSARERGIDVYISVADGLCLENATGTLAKFVGVNYTPIKDYKTLSEGEYDFGGIKVKVLETAGHTKGSLTFVVEDCMFTGDTLFRMTVGRTDLPTGSGVDMKNSLKNLVNFYKNGNINYKVYPGHGSESDFLYEYDNNPYILQIK